MFVFPYGACVCRRRLEAAVSIGAICSLEVPLDPRHTVCVCVCVCVRVCVCLCVQWDNGSCAVIAFVAINHWVLSFRMKIPPLKSTEIKCKGGSVCVFVCVCVCVCLCVFVCVCVSWERRVGSWKNQTGCWEWKMRNRACLRSSDSLLLCRRRWSEFWYVIYMKMSADVSGLIWLIF